MAAKGCKKCDPHEICEECPEWIFTLADLIMCMMGLFVILWVLKPNASSKPGEPGSEELTKIVAAIREAFGKVPDPNSTDPVDMYMLMNQVSRLKTNGPGERGKTLQESKGAEGTDSEVTSIRQSKQATEGGRIGFERGSAGLSRTATASLDQIVTLIKGHRNVVIVKGHTSLDDLGESATFEQKLELSYHRAQAVCSYLISKGVSPVMLRPLPCSTSEPLQQQAYTPELQALNRRVEIEVTSTLVDQFQDRPRGAEPARGGAR